MLKGSFLQTLESSGEGSSSAGDNDDESAAKINKK